jgi:ABC-type polar amino acid transport system ATPase subunit
VGWTCSSGPRARVPDRAVRLGKSTLLRCCNRLEEPTSGSIRIDGVDLLARSTDINKVRRRVGMVFQSFNLYPHLTALGNVTLALRKALGRSRGRGGPDRPPEP